MTPENKYSSVPHWTHSACAHFPTASVMRQLEAIKGNQRQSGAIRRTCAHFCTASVMILARAIADTRSAFASQKRASALKARIDIRAH